jgi:hypothetical protein
LECEAGESHAHAAIPAFDCRRSGHGCKGDGATPSKRRPRLRIGVPAGRPSGRFVASVTHGRAVATVSTRVADTVAFMRPLIIHRMSSRAIAAALAAAALTGCTTVGIGNGELRPGRTPVQFDWSSDDGGISGVMRARIGTGASFTGPFVQITHQESSIAAAVEWDSWPGEWDAPGGEVTYPDVGLTTSYSGRVEADLASADGQRMHCRFTLNTPPAGMNRGGHGQCRLGDGSTVDAVFHRG